MTVRIAALAALLAAPPAAGVRVDVAAAGAVTPFPHYWKGCVGSGHAQLGTRVDWRAHLAQAVKDIGVRGIRMHGVLDDDMSVVSTTVDDPNFYNVDLVYDYLMELNVKPIVELSFMPSAIAATPCEYAFGNRGGYKGLQCPPRDFDEWHRLIRSFVAHLVDRYTLEEVATWRFEVWNEMWGVAYPDAYLPLYNASATAVKAVHKSLRVGGPATMQTQFVQAFIEDTARLGYPRDFVSTHLYPSDPNCTEAAFPTSTSQDCFADVVIASAKLAVDAGLPYLLTEYNDGLMLGPGDPKVGRRHADKSYAAAFAVRNVQLLSGRGVDVASWWTFTDVFEENWLTGLPFQGGFGLLTTHGVAKPAYRAFEMLHTLGTERVPATLTHDDAQGAVTALSVRGGGADGKCLDIVLANFAPQSGAIQPGYERQLAAATVSLNVEGCAAGQCARATVASIDDDTTAPLRAWEAMGSPRYPTKAQIDALHDASRVKTESLPTQVALGGGVALTVTLPPYGVKKVSFCD